MNASPPSPTSGLRQLGTAGEDAAAAYVQRLGWRIVARNWRPRAREIRGELDLVAVDRDALVVCEVKTRSARGAGDPAAAVTTDKLRRLRALARAWLADCADGHGHAVVRIDVIAVIWPRSALAPSITHLRDVRL
jgi:putative endonuclease